MQLGTAADELALALELGLATVDDAILWADAAIADLAVPPHALIELAMARREPAAQVAHLLRAVPGSRDREGAAAAVLARLAHSVRLGRTSPRYAATLLYELAMRNELPQGATDEAISLDDAFSLALDGTHGTVEEVTADLFAFLGRHAGPTATSQASARSMVDLARLFPTLAKQLERGLGDPIEEVLPGLSEVEVAALERSVGLDFPPSYRAFLRCTRGIWFLGGMVQMSRAHPFFHERGPSDGMLCFAELFMEADGDQVLFDVTRRGADGEFPVMYYAHEDRPPTVRELAPSFRGWLEQFLEYPELSPSDDE